MKVIYKFMLFKYANMSIVLVFNIIDLNYNINFFNTNKIQWHM